MKALKTFYLEHLHMTGLAGGNLCDRELQNESNADGN